MLMRHIISLAIFTISFIFNLSAQRISKEYFIGKWKSTDSLTGIEDTVQFKNYDILIFSNEHLEWQYSLEILDSFISINYNLKSKKVVMLNEGKLITQNDTCFWWFASKDFEFYSNALHNGYNIVDKDKFNAWLKERRDVFFKIGSN